MLRRRDVTVMLLLLPMLPGSITSAETTVSIENVGKQIAEAIPFDKTAKIAVTDFLALDGTVSNFGRLIAEEITTALLSLGYQVIERRLIDKVRQEHEEINSLGAELGDPKNVTLIGHRLGAQLLMAGTYADMGSTIRLNVRIIKVDTTAIAGATAISMTATEPVRRLLSTALVAPPAKPSQPGGSSAKAEEPRDNAFLYEDFSKVSEGQVPSGWKGVDHMCVRKLSNGESYLEAFQKGGNLITIPGVKFPANYRIELEAMLDGRENPSMLFQLGGLMLGVQEINGSGKNYQSVIGQTIAGSFRIPEGEKFVLSAVKSDGVYKLLLNESLLQVSREVINLVPSMGKLLIDFSVRWSREKYQASGRIYSVKGLAI